MPKLERRYHPLLIFSFLLILFSLTRAWAQSPDDQLKLNDLQQQQQQLEQKLDSIRQKKKSLENEIAYMDTQISLTKTKIQVAQTAIQLKQEEITRLQGDIGLLGGKLESLGKTLDRQRAVFAVRAAAAYKSNQSGVLEMFLVDTADYGFSYFINRLKYLKVFEIQDSQFLKQMEDTQQVFQTQKIILSDKKDQVDEIKQQIETQKRNLEAYQASLSRQEKEKRNLLAATSSDEDKYQQLLAQVKTEIAAIRGFVGSQGGASLLANQTVCNDWGCYYNQRDSQWGLNPLGNSNLSMAEFGCLVSSSAMLASHYKRNLSPADIAADSSAFFSPDSSTAFLWKDITVSGIRILRTSLSPTTASIDSELAAGRPVIVGLYAGPAHFVVIKSGANGNYVMNDPFVPGGHDLNFTDKYPLSAITEVERVTIN